MARWDWIGRHKKSVAAAALGVGLMVAVALGIWFGWDLKTLIGWRALVNYINPEDATDRKDAVQVYALIVAGVVVAITAAVGLLNLRLTRRNLEQQRELEQQRADQQRKLEAQRAQGTALQAYYEQIGKLITDQDLLNTQRKEIRELARGQTLTVLQEVDGKGKGSLLTFLYGAGLIIGAENPAVALTGADLKGADLPQADLQGADLRGASLYGADLKGADFKGAELKGAELKGAELKGAELKGAELFRADLKGADLKEADLRGADLLRADFRGADLKEADLQGADLQGALELTQEQIEWTYGSKETELPEGLNRPQLWSKSIEEQTKIIQERLRGQ